jgi:hypothetical protein
MANIYRKTAKGVDEIANRTHRLAPRARTALILVDGQRSEEDLTKLVQVQAAETLALLVQQGFIEGLNVGTAAAPAPSAGTTRDSGAGRSSAGEAGNESGFSSTSAPQRNFSLVRREAVKRLTDLLGPGAETLALRMEATQDLAALRPLLVRARDLIAASRGQQAANNYITELSAL